jgi:hypothetical protein
MSEDDIKAAETMNKAKPKSFNEALGAFKAAVTEEDESALLLAEQEAREAEEARVKSTVKVPEVTDQAPEDWMTACIPTDIKFPLNKQAHFLKFRAQWTETPTFGDRTCIMWNLTDADEKLAAKRCKGDGARYAQELAKQMVRAIDGEKVDWTKGLASNIERWWNAIGSKCRNMLVNVYHKNHNLNAEEQKDFFVNCYSVRTVTTG